ncbi:MAG: hypothetical protein AB9834_01715 [Lentimicrobium sp.]
MEKKPIICLIALLAGHILYAQNFRSYDSLSLSKPIFGTLNGEPVYDSFKIRFSCYDKHNPLKRISLKDLSRISFKADEYSGQRREKSPEYIPGSLIHLKDEKGKPDIPDGATFSILIVNSPEIRNDFPQIKHAIKSLAHQMPEGSIYLSVSDHIVSSSRLYSESALDNLELSESVSGTDLYNSILIKLHEFNRFQINENAILEGCIFEPAIAKRAEQDTITNYLIVLTNGMNDIGRIQKYKSGTLYNYISSDALLEEIEKNNAKTRLFIIDFNSNILPDNRGFLDNICRKSGNPGGYIVKNKPLQDIFRQNIIDAIISAYEIAFKTVSGITLAGDERRLNIYLLENKDTLAMGSVTYMEGNPVNPVQSGSPEPRGITLLTGLLAGIILILFILILIQIIYPLVRNRIFQFRYYKRYKPQPNEKKRLCPVCFDEILSSDIVVMKCEHIVHKNCWIKGGYMCPEFGQNCNTGKQDYFDLKDPFSTRNKTYYLKWVLFGLIGGLLAWVLYLFLKDSGLFNGISGKAVQWFATSNLEPKEKDDLIKKIAPSLISGTLLGFLFCIAFAYTEEYRRLSWPVGSRILLRGVAGALIGFLSIYIGSIFAVIFNEPGRNFWIDSIPWLIFGAAVGYSLSIKTTIHWKHGLIGGLISVIFSFLVWYGMSRELKNVVALVIGYMLYGAGLGFSIATVRSTAEQYFIKILNGAKEGNLIAVHKWMSSQGGLNEVYIGMSNVCEIQMNWEKEQLVCDKHAKMYINNTRKMPVLVSLRKEYVTLYDERIEMSAGKEYDLINGVTFKIGGTVFQYIEKDFQS